MIAAGKIKASGSIGQTFFESSNTIKQISFDTAPDSKIALPVTIKQRTQNKKNVGNEREGKGRKGCQGEGEENGMVHLPEVMKTVDLSLFDT